MYRHAEVEDTAAVLGRVKPHLAAVGGDNAVGHVEGQSPALRVGGQGVLTPEETLEDLALIFFRDAHASIRNLEDGVVTLVVDADGDLAPGLPKGSSCYRKE